MNNVCCCLLRVGGLGGNDDNDDDDAMECGICFSIDSRGRIFVCIN